MHHEACRFKEMSCSTASKPGERNADAVGDATTKVLTKIQVIGEANSGESDDRDLGLDLFVEVNTI